VPHKDKKVHDDMRRRSKGAGFKAKKRLGQNFLVDESVRDAIIEAACISAEDIIVEVGPGLGVLTEKLADLAGRVVAVELDEDLSARLKNKLAHYDRLEIVHDDILQVDLKSVLGTDISYKVVANIPYYITSPILRYFMQNVVRPSLMVIMMQEEVAIDVTSKPGHMTFLSVSMQLFSRPEVVCKVPSASFHPAPRVDSAVVKFNMLEKPAIPAEDIDSFLELVHAGFAAPRKQMHNSLALGLKLETDKAVSLLKKSGIDPQRRPGTLTIPEWWELYSNNGVGHC
jgi:16S rRNA (adenine1518-N6/adenine1519-N6)-dimethyltransferase